METRISTSDLAVCASNYTEKAWHLAAVLLSIGKPVSPSELAGKCSLFDTSPEFVEFLCFIPNSPLLLTKSGLILLSVEVFTAAGNFFAHSMPKLEIQAFGAAQMLRFGRSGDVVHRYLRKRKRFESAVMPLVKKRAVLGSVDGNERESVYSSDGILSTSTTVHGLQSAYLGCTLNAVPYGMLTKTINIRNFGDLMANPSVGLLEYQLNIKNQKSGHKQNTYLVNDKLDCVVMEGCQAEDMPDCNKESSTALLLESLAEVSAVSVGNELDTRNLMSKIDSGGPSCTELDQHNRISPVEAASVINGHDELLNRQLPETRTEYMAEQLWIDYGAPGERFEDLPFGSNGIGVPLEDKMCQTNKEISMHKTPTFQEEQSDNKASSQPFVSANPGSRTRNLSTKISPVVKNVPQRELTQKKKITSKLLQQNKVDKSLKEGRDHKDQHTIATKDKAQHIARSSPFLQGKDAHKLSKDQQELKYPVFDLYTVEEEEGSGGYGTVYRARRKSDGVTFAVKYPHANAHKHHVKNELKMLERFGGRNFVIKYEGHFECGSADCFVLEHVEHDRPEVLKREIKLNQLQWYGYCMFRALASLHRQAVFHRDVKPGNFLFSCKTSKGYLIDFNLAKDMNQKYGITDKPQPGYVTGVQHVPAPQSKSASPSKRRKILGGKSLEAVKPGVSGIDRTLGSKTLKKKALDKLKAYDDLGRRNSITSQGADGSGLTSKDITSTRTPSAERLREPIPCQGRKELINLAQEAMQNPNLGAASAPVSKRKRVAASPGIMDKKLIYLTPTPLHSSGIAISGAGSLKNRGEVKPHKEGPCVGTKGFRAPEVLLRSIHQSPKIDVWSAGVTLLYLITGKMPFTGDPEQNMKDIVKLKGNEELWEVAKLHNRESSFPVELLDIRFLQSTTIKDWCVANTKRPDFVELLPSSLFDLIEKCLAVNPRLRITSEEALRHEFFAPCRDALERQRSRRQCQNPNQRSNSLPLLHDSVGLPHKQLIPL